MKLDENMKKNLLALDNDEIRNVVRSLADAAGVGNKFKISDSDIGKLREAVKNATDKDAERAIEKIGEENARRILGELGKSGE